MVSVVHNLPRFEQAPEGVIDNDTVQRNNASGIGAWMFRLRAAIAIATALVRRNNLEHSASITQGELPLLHGAGLVSLSEPV